MAADIVARKSLSQKQNSPRVNRLLCLSRSVPGDETHVEDLPGGGQSNLERYIAGQATYRKLKIRREKGPKRMSESEAERAGVGAGAGGPASGQLQAIFLRTNLMRCYCCQPARRLAGSLFYLVLLLLLITMAIIIVAHAVSIPVQDYFQCFFC
ncbi:hypothetical protein BO85DRAFT_486250 [Aspergillus piperis CBS 112811]|uniref:Uncharacterized protein n=1 Tax=Aspergillus piperis CBS 112811 TaxID=1448313 RepID=A0A8G1R6Y1_9EURO|nr:hypothetical protein BO85DRAFT_486250 [Aspergillus piperis CBS 112811]RAH59791.1 hypothetical protein BO85DRAFT_486250 [Aspergillus piperis CBS 112811]